METVVTGRVAAAEGMVTVAIGAVSLALARICRRKRPRCMCIRAEDVVLTCATGAASSVRTARGDGRFGASRTAAGAVELDCGFPLKALITRQALEELKLQPGANRRVVKAPHVHLIGA
jgi:molybdate transport system ATP-binding protein